MNNFTIKTINKNCYEVYLNLTGHYMLTTDTLDKAKAISEALDKQILEIPVTEGNKKWICPKCKNEVDAMSKYCRNCGQRLI
mgnify:CR=1 FL=1